MMEFKVCKDTEQLVERLMFIRTTTFLLNRLTTILINDLKLDPVPYTPYKNKALGNYTEAYEIIADMAKYIGVAAESL